MPIFSTAVESILAKVTELTGKGFDFVEKRDLAQMAGIKIARRSMPCHILQYKPTTDIILDHLVAHECGHILRMMAAPEAARLIPATTRETATAALTPLAHEFERIAKRIPVDAAPGFFSMLHHGLIRQLTNFPSDIAVERWMFNEYPLLREAQSRSMVHQRDEATAGLNPRIESLSPKLIFDSCNTMNYAFLEIIGELIGTPTLLGRFATSRFKDKGEELLRLTAEFPLATYEDDIAMVDRWADFLGLRKWYVWRGFESVPDGYESE